MNLLPIAVLMTFPLAQPGAAGLPGDPSPTLQEQVDRSVRQAVQQFAARNLRADQIALTVVDLTNPARPLHAHHRGDVPIYPASVVKLFYLVAAHRWLEDGRLEDTPELQRALRDMIVDSYNEATHYVVDLLTGTTSGPELPPDELALWHERRNAVNRYFTSLGYPDINVNKKPWCEGPYGRETQAIRAFTPKRNALTTDATARLLTEIATGKAVSAQRCEAMRELLRRDPFGTADRDPDAQARFTGPALPPGSKLWSKAGWTSETRHDAAYLELPDGRKLVLVIFTVDHASERTLLPTLAGPIVAPQTTPP